MSNVASAGGTNAVAGEGSVRPQSLPWTLCFIRRGAQLLMLQRRREPNLGLWSGVGGKLDPGEPIRDGMLREVREETGIDLLPDDLRYCGVVTWHREGQPPKGAYAFIASVADDFEYPTPVETDEGVLDWKDAQWVLAPDNEGVPASARRYLRTLLEESGCYEHAFTFADDVITGYTILPLDDVRSG